MVVPSRKNKMMHKIIKGQERDKKKLKGKDIESKDVNPEEHKKRIEMLKKIGLLKKG